MTAKRIVRVVTLIAIIAMMLLLLAGCGFVADGPVGWVYTDTTMPVSMGTAQNGTKAGRGCIHSFFGAISIGNGSIETAMKDGGIKNVYTVNKENLSIFGTYTRQCTLVSGE
ncbi:TRL-like family protein [Candidatus Magnetominusculus dajiuhuensis]|uniref:TRL-like family protein n=1 Tax=Candidatus Magnetominusculus dajiuhuensis TaxID=3137712 RepID=UPI003B432899